MRMRSNDAVLLQARASRKWRLWRIIYCAMENPAPEYFAYLFVFRCENPKCAIPLVDWHVYVNRRSNNAWAKPFPYTCGSCNYQGNMDSAKCQHATECRIKNEESWVLRTRSKVEAKPGLVPPPAQFSERTLPLR